MFTEQRRIRSDRPVDPEDEDQKREAAPRVRTVRRLIETDDDGAGTLTLADYVANGHSTIGSIAAAARAKESRRVLETKVFVTPGTVACTVARRTLTFVGFQGDQEIYSDLGDGKMMDLYQARLQQAEHEDQMSQPQARRAGRGSEEATTYMRGKNPLITYAIAVCAVLHVTDDTLGNPVPLGRTDWFSLSGGENHARSESAKYPAPQRFLVFDKDDQLQSIWQSGQKVSLFTVETERTKEAKSRARASTSARARRMAVAAHRAKRTVEQSPGEQTFEEFVAAFAVPPEQVEAFRTWLKRAPHWSVTLPSMLPEEWEGMWWLFKGGVTVASQQSREASQQMSSAEAKRPVVEQAGEMSFEDFLKWDYSSQEAGFKDEFKAWVQANKGEDALGPKTADEWTSLRAEFESATFEADRTVAEQQSPKGRKLCYKHHSEEFDKLPSIRRGEAASWTTVDPSECEICQADSGQEAWQPATESVRGPVEGEVVWLSSTGEAMTIQGFDWPNEKVVLAGAGGQKVVALDSLRYFGSSGIDWMSDSKQAGEIGETRRPARETEFYEFTFQPQSELGVVSDVVNVRMPEPDGRVVGYVKAQDVSRFKSGDASVFTPIPGWRAKYSVQLKDKLGLSREYGLAAQRPAREQVNVGDVERGDLVDFGAYGQLYVADPGYRGDWWWVTDIESQRFNRRTSGHTIKPYLAERIIEKWDDGFLGEEPEEYEGYLESAKGQTAMYNAVLGDGTIAANAPAHSKQEALEALGQELRAGDRAVYIDWLNEGRVEQAPDPTLEEAFAWTGSLAAGVAAGRVDEVQIDPGLSTLIEALDREVRASRTMHLVTEDDWQHAQQWMRQNYMRAKDRIKPGNWSAIDLAKDYAYEFVVPDIYAGAYDRLEEEASWILQSIVGADKVDYWTG